MSDAENMSRKELLQQNRFEKKLYAFADHAYRNKRNYIGAAVSLVVIIMGTWGVWKYVQSERVNQANLFHIARSKISNSALSNEERLNQGIAALHPEVTVFLKNSARLSLAALFEQQKQWDEAEMMLESIDISSWDDVRLRALARIAVEKGEIEKARNLLEQLIESVPDSVFLNESETLLLTL